MQSMEQNPKITLNDYLMKYRLVPDWSDDTHGVARSCCKNWTIHLSVPLPSGDILQVESSGPSKKEGEVSAAYIAVEQLRDLGLLEGLKTGAGDTKPAPPVGVSVKEEQVAVKEEPEEESATTAGEPTKVKNPPPPDNPKVAINNYCMKHRIKPEWRDVTPGGAGGAGKNWVMCLVIHTPEGITLEAIGSESSKKGAEMAASAQALKQLQGTSSLREAGILAGDGLVLEPPPKRAKTTTSTTTANVLQQGGVDAATQAVIEQEEILETFGYSLAVSRTQLNMYLEKRRLPKEIPVVGTGGSEMPPFVASLEIPPRQRHGEPLFAQAQAQKKNDAMNQVAFRLCVQLCEMGELPPFQTKAQAQQDGIAPCYAEISDEHMGRLDEVLLDLGCDVGFSDLQMDTPVQTDFDADAWATVGEAAEITWEPPEWGRSPWTDGHGEPPPGDELSVALQLSAEMEARDSSARYQGTLRKRSELPVAYVSDEILSAIKASPVTLISGSTGCGKTTQVPQLLLEQAILDGDATRTNVVCTQPRRIAAITVAERVAQERGEVIGESVGYCVRFAQVMPRGYASVCYMTTGMLLRRLSGRGLRGVSHVIIDEVHERDLDSDFLIIVIRQLVQSFSGLRVVLMSATIDLAQWGAYFGQGFGTPIEIPGRLFPVSVHYVEDFLRMANIGGEVMRNSKPNDEIPFEVTTMLLEYIVGESSTTDRGAVLVFLSGWDTIDNLHKRLKQSSIRNMIKVHILHSQVPKDEQQAAFHPAQAPFVKVILSTNIAESSVTISDVTYVVDSCRVKQLAPIESAGGRQAYRLASTWASKQSLQQRAGRAGRVREGVCFRLVSRSQFARLPESLMPEMVRVPLHQVTLLLKSLNLGGAAQFLALAPDPPPLASVERALAALMDLKALDQNENITTLGVQLAKIPIDPRMGFALMAACLFGLAEPLSVLAALSAAPSLYHDDKRRGKDLAARGRGDVTAQTLLSDHYDALMTFYRLRDLPIDQAASVCMRENLNFKVFLQVNDAAEQTAGILSRMGFGPDPVSYKEWLWQLGTRAETHEHHTKWATLVFLLGIGLEHFAVRKSLSRKVWVGKGKTSQVALSPGIPEVPPQDPMRPFFLFAELQESEWTSNCRGVSAAGAIATILGAARELRYDHVRGCLLLDGWAPVKLSHESAVRLGAARSALRICLLTVAKDPAAQESCHQIPILAQLIAEMCGNCL